MNFGSHNKFKNVATYILPLLGIIMMVAFCALVWFWESYGREMYLYTDVVAAKEDIKPGTIIKSDMLKIGKEVSSKLTSNAIIDINTIIGYAAKSHIPKNALIDIAYLEHPDMILAEDQYIFQLPKEWIKAVPNTLRRKDTGYIYLVNSKLFVTDTVRKSEGNVNGSTLIPTYPSGQGSNYDVVTDKSIIKTQIAYVKDAANREVVTLSEQDRIDGSSTIAEIEVILTMEEFKRIESAIVEGYKIMIMYRGQ